MSMFATLTYMDLCKIVNVRHIDMFIDLAIGLNFLW